MGGYTPSAPSGKLFGKIVVRQAEPAKRSGHPRNSWTSGNRASAGDRQTESIDMTILYKSNPLLDLASLADSHFAASISKVSSRSPRATAESCAGGCADDGSAFRVRVRFDFGNPLAQPSSQGSG